MRLPAFLPILALCSCGPLTSTAAPVVPFETATAWIYQGADSTALAVEIARSEAQHEQGLSGRRALDPQSGMVFQFPGVRSGDEGFWMVGAEVPLDIAFISEDGRILRILSMDLCQDGSSDQPCRGYFPGVEYSSALETNQGWFDRNGIGVGSRVIVVP